MALDELLLAVVTRLQALLAGRGAEVAHIKTIGLAEEAFGVANVIASDHYDQGDLIDAVRKLNGFGGQSPAETR